MINILSWFFTGLSILGGFLVTGIKPKTRLFAFIIWIIANIFWVCFNFYFKHYAPLFLFSIYSIQSIIGILKNIKEIKNV